MAGDWDCAIVGGGAAGLSAALVLGRARRRVLLLDAGEQSNLPAHGIGGLLGHDGTPPAALYARGHEELGAYPSVEVRREAVTDARADEAGAVVVTAAGQLRARTVLLAMGMRYTPPEIPGLAPLWGDTVFHCPFCHGWELRDRPLAVYGRGEHTPLQAVLLTGWSADVVVLTDGPAPFAAETMASLASAGARVEERPVAELAQVDGRLRAVVFADGAELPREGMLVAAPLRQRSGLAEALGVELTEGGTVAVDDRGRTSVPGVFAAGDVAAPMQLVALAIAAGSVAAATIVHDLMTGAHGLPLPGHPEEARRAPPPRSRWTSFVADPTARTARGLQEQGNPAHRLRVEHNRHTLLVHLSGEDGDGWTTLAVDRATRAWAVEQAPRQREAAEGAWGRLYPD